MTKKGHILTVALGVVLCLCACATKSGSEILAVSKGGAIVFSRAPLALVAVCVNFPNGRQLQIADVDAGRKRISGTYVTDDPDGVALAIRELYPDLAVSETGGGWVVATRHSPDQL